MMRLLVKHLLLLLLLFITTPCVSKYTTREKNRFTNLIFICQR
ncbi:GSCOCG00004159001-RA-CDS [Cotesia congregata]|nr:GSCOCG00004159001-RA-CDS [Cotesia congregata]